MPLNLGSQSVTAYLGANPAALYLGANAITTGAAIPPVVEYPPVYSMRREASGSATLFDDRDILIGLTAPATTSITQQMRVRRSSFDFIVETRTVDIANMSSAKWYDPEGLVTLLSTNDWVEVSRVTYISAPITLGWRVIWGTPTEDFIDTTPSNSEFVSVAGSLLGGDATIAATSGTWSNYSNLDILGVQFQTTLTSSNTESNNANYNVLLPFEVQLRPDPAQEQVLSLGQFIFEHNHVTSVQDSL